MGLVLTWPVGRAADGDGSTQPAPAGPVLAYLAGTTLGGTLTGLVVGAVVALLAPLPDEVRLVAAGALLLAAVVAELRGTVAPLPERRGQVPRTWLAWPSRTLAFGIMIGAGVATFLKHAVAYALLAIALVAPSPWAAVLVGTGYGFARGATLAATWLGDRYLGRRPPEAPVEERHLPLNVVLAVIASVSFAVAASVIAP
jgi:hypothetical protein